EWAGASHPIPNRHELTLHSPLSYRALLVSRCLSVARSIPFLGVVQRRVAVGEPPASAGGASPALVAAPPPAAPPPANAGGSLRCSCYPSRWFPQPCPVSCLSFQSSRQGPLDQFRDGVGGEGPVGGLILDVQVGGLDAAVLLGL